MSAFEYTQDIASHYIEVWGSTPEKCYMRTGPVHELPLGFHVLKFRPANDRQFFVYATCGMSRPNDDKPVELHLLSPVETDMHVELLSAICHYHHTGSRLGLNDTVNLGRPWLDDSCCSYGLLSLPYLYGPKLEWIDTVKYKVRFLWLIPITHEEREYKKGNGVEALETIFEQKQLNYLNPRRASVV